MPLRILLSDYQNARLDEIGRRLSREGHYDNSFSIISEMLESVFNGRTPTFEKFWDEENGGEYTKVFVDTIARRCANVGADSKIIRWVLRMICAGVRDPEDFKISVAAHQGSLRKAAKAATKYERAYWLIHVMKYCGLIDDVKAPQCLRTLRNSIRVDAAVQATEIALLKVASDGRLLDVEAVHTRIKSWLRSDFLNSLSHRPAPKPLSWHYFGEVETLPNDLQAQTIEEIIDGIQVDPLLTTRKISWKLLPPGKHPFPDLVRHYEHLQKNEGGLAFDEQRLKKICELELTDTYTGLDDFRGYIVFDYAQYGFAILECPIVGNAIYILLGDWKTLSRLSKAELLNSYSENTIRITHSGDWFERLNNTVCSLRKNQKPQLQD